MTQKRCQFFGLTGFIVHASLVFLVFLVLIIKRITEFPKRPLIIWFLDVTKQGISQVIAHVLNIIISLYLRNQDNKQSDPCIWYFSTLLLDFTIGVGFCFAGLKFIQICLLINHKHLTSGNYYTIQQSLQDQQQPKIQINKMDWFIQLLIFTLLIIIAKFLILILSKSLGQSFNELAHLMIGWLKETPKLQLLAVMFVMPLLLNGICFWVLDNLVMKKVQIKQAKSASQEGIQECNKVQQIDEKQQIQ